MSLELRIVEENANLDANFEEPRESQNFVEPEDSQKFEEAEESLKFEEPEEIQNFMSHEQSQENLQQPDPSKNAPSLNSLEPQDPLTRQNSSPTQNLDPTLDCASIMEQEPQSEGEFDPNASQKMLLGTLKS